MSNHDLSMQNFYVYDTKIGRIAIAENGAAITRLELAEHLDLGNMQIGETALLKEAAKQLDEYLDGVRKTFDLLLAPEGTQFQKAVWKALQAIPYGETRSYAQIAQAIGNPKAGRAVGGANHANPIMIVIPCHRVIGANGELVGYGGGLELKRQLLELEKTAGA